MRILFATDAVNQVSTQLNAPNYAKLNELDGVHIDFYNHNYADYDVVLFMGYDPRVAEARAAKPSLKIGVIDIRPSSLDKSMGADFAIANGVEMQDWLSEYFENILIYPIYPLLNASLREYTPHKPVIIGYHGNKVHLMACMPHVSLALEALSAEYEIEFWAIYDIEKLGKIVFPLFNPDKVKVRYFQWTEDVYERIISQVDIGIVPSLIPMKNEMLAKKQVAPFSPLLQPHETDCLLRFKNTTNAGRIYVFSQLGIPVVAGMSPSAAQAIRHNVNGYLAYSTGGWYRALKSLAESAQLRSQMGRALYEDFHATASPNILNENLVYFIRALTPLPELQTSRFANADKTWTKRSQSKTPWLNWLNSLCNSLGPKKG
ncbi:MAG: hypothetical protein JW963_03555 [Anaerolineales bacterium]|nr:hypothetical protein [Anaerolineales bacterium]